MPGIVDLVRLISLDVTRGLVLQGLGLGFDGKRYTNTGSPARLGIVNASNTTPIVLTCDRPHSIPTLRATGRANELHAVVEGVEGNTAANAIDEGPRSRTIGQSRGVQLIPITPTQFEMYAPAYSTGLLEPLSGNGTYTTGGTITPALTAGRIRLGRDKTPFEQWAPPYLAFVPIGSEFGGRDLASGSPTLTADPRNEKLYRSLATESVIAELHAWGAATVPDPDVDFDITQRLYQQFFQSVHLLNVGTFLARKGDWIDQHPKETQVLKLGHYHVTTYAFMTPILEQSMPFVEPPIVIDPTTYVHPLDGSASEVGCSG